MLTKQLKQTIVCHQSPVTCHLSPVSNNYRHIPNPLLTPPLCIVDWFAKNPNLKLPTNFETPKIIKKKERVSQFCHFSNTLFDQKSPVHAVPVAGGGDKLQTHGHYDLKKYSVRIQFIYMELFCGNLGENMLQSKDLNSINILIKKNAKFL